MSIVVEMRECRIWPCTSFGLAPASTIQVACEVRKQGQLIQGRPSLRAAGLMEHTRKGRATVELHERSGEIQMTVSDPGVGFVQQDTVNLRGLGLISMRERLQMHPST
jgi:nitrate/nitrite-specific signal transduction histidine kinase